MDIRKIKKLIELIEESEISEIEIQEGEESVRISRDKRALQPEVPNAVTQMPHAAGSTRVSDVVVPSQPAPAAPEPVAKQDDGNVITSPMVGVFYYAPSPESEPYVHLNQQINVGQTLCVIEAMKMMNHIESEIAGKVIKIFPENGQPVEYGQALFLIQPI